MASNTAAEAPGSGGFQDRIAAERYPDRKSEHKAREPHAVGRLELRPSDLSPIAYTIASASPHAIFITDAERRVTFVNRVGEQMFGFSMAEARGQTLHGLLQHTRPDGCPLAEWACHVGWLFATCDSIRDHRDIFFRSDGTTLHVSVNNAPVVLEGDVTGCVVTVRDVTQEDFERREMSKTNDRLASALATAELGVWDTNFITGEVYWDSRMKSLFGLPPDEEVTLASANGFIHPDDRPLARTSCGGRHRT